MESRAVYITPSRSQCSRMDGPMLNQVRWICHHSVARSNVDRTTPHDDEQVLGCLAGNVSTSAPKCRVLHCRSVRLSIEFWSIAKTTHSNCGSEDDHEYEDLDVPDFLDSKRNFDGYNDLDIDSEEDDLK